MRNQFTFYRSYWECAEKFQTNKEKLEFFQMLCAYALDETEPDLDAKKPAIAAPSGQYLNGRTSAQKAHGLKTTCNN